MPVRGCRVSLPEWLRRTLGDTYRSVRLRTCTRCNAPVLAGLDADNCAFAARVDMTPISATGEAVALLTGRRTFDLVGGGGEKKLYIREDHNIKSDRRYLVFAEHRCGQSLAAYLDETAKTTTRKKTPRIPQF